MKIYTALLVFACISLSSCGQTGPLYLPESGQTPPADQTEAPATPEQQAEDTTDSQQ
jgi:predicted small lipoprotein YifL